MKNFDDLEETVNKYPCQKIPNKVELPSKGPQKEPPNYLCFNIMGNLSQVNRDPNPENQVLLHDYHHSFRAYSRTQGIFFLKFIV